MIHKNGTKWWFNHAQEKYAEIVFGENYGYSSKWESNFIEDKVIESNISIFMLTHFRTGHND